MDIIALHFLTYYNKLSKKNKKLMERVSIFFYGSNIPFNMWE
jgi:hypothetical protein